MKPFEGRTVITHPETAELQRLLEAATPGPWTVDACDPSDVVVWAEGGELVTNIGQRVQPVQVAFDCDERNAALIALAPTLAAQVIRLTEALRDLIDRYDEVVTDPDCSCSQDDHAVTQVRAALGGSNG